MIAGQFARIVDVVAEIDGARKQLLEHFVLVSLEACRDLPGIVPGVSVILLTRARPNIIRIEFVGVDAGLVLPAGKCTDAGMRPGHDS